MPTYKELVKQIAELQKEADALRDAEVESVKKEILELMKAYNLTPEDFLQGKKSMKVVKIKTPLPPQFRDPVSGQEWVGRGPQPQWMKEALAQGKSKQDFLIAAQN